MTERTQEFADNFFDKLCSNGVPLAALVIELREAGQNCCSLDLKRYGFLLGRQISLFGRSEAVGIPVKAKMVRHYVHPSYILDHDFGLAR